MKYKMRIMKYTIFGLLFILIGFICSCADDKGNYNYQDINKLSIRSPSIHTENKFPTFSTNIRSIGLSMGIVRNRDISFTGKQQGEEYP